MSSKITLQFISSALCLFASHSGRAMDFPPVAGSPFWKQKVYVSNNGNWKPGAFFCSNETATKILYDKAAFVNSYGGSSYAHVIFAPTLLYWERGKVAGHAPLKTAGCRGFQCLLSTTSNPIEHFSVSMASNGNQNLLGSMQSQKIPPETCSIERVPFKCLTDTGIYTFASLENGKSTLSFLPLDSKKKPVVSHASFESQENENEIRYELLFEDGKKVSIFRNSSLTFPDAGILFQDEKGNDKKISCQAYAFQETETEIIETPRRRLEEFTAQTRFSDFCREINLSQATLKTRDALLDILAPQGIREISNEQRCQEAENNLQSVTELDLANKKLTDPFPLTYLTQLEKLNLAGNHFQRLEFLAAFPALQTLDVSKNNIRSLYPLLALKKLKNLDISSNRVTDLGALSPLTTLIDLRANDNLIENIGTIVDLIHLETLFLDRNRIKTLTDLARPQSRILPLQKLSLEENQLISIEKIGILSNLQWVSLKKNKILNAYPLEALGQLTYLDASFNNLTDISALSLLPHLVGLNLAHNQISKPGPLRLLKKLQNLDLSKNPLLQRTCPLIKKSLCTL
jgi:Leucine-rich repeat (LRR) protein